MVWVDMTGKVLGTNLYRNFNIEILAVDRDATAYGCGGSLDAGNVECVAFTSRSEAPKRDTIPLPLSFARIDV